MPQGHETAPSDPRSPLPCNLLFRSEGYVKKIDLSGWDMDAAATFNQLNRGLIQEQQLVSTFAFMSLS